MVAVQRFQSDLAGDARGKLLVSPKRGQQETVSVHKLDTDGPGAYQEKRELKETAWPMRREWASPGLAPTGEENEGRLARALSEGESCLRRTSNKTPPQMATSVLAAAARLTILQPANQGACSTAGPTGGPCGVCGGTRCSCGGRRSF